MSKKKELSFIEKMDIIYKTGLEIKTSPNRKLEIDEISTIEERLKTILNIVENKRPAGYMLFFVMYDIESNKARTQIVKYLQREGCIRVQKSVFLADLPSSKYEEIRNNLVEVQKCYDNNDSILVVPISMDYLYSMKIIGQTLNIDFITKNKSTLFF